MSDEKKEEQEFEGHQLGGDLDKADVPGQTEPQRLANDKGEDDDFEGHKLGVDAVERGVVERGKAESV